MGIRPTTARQRLTIAGLILYVLLILVLAFIKGGSHIPDSDFGTFWLAGKHFFAGEKLYEPAENDRHFIYPPFAAFCFQLFAAMPFSLAAIFMYFLNGLLFPLSVFLIYRILKKQNIPEERIRIALALSVLFSAKYFWDNISMFQMNSIVLVLVLLGIHNWLCRSSERSGAYFAIGTFIKLTPVFFLLYFLVNSWAIFNYPKGSLRLLFPWKKENIANIRFPKNQISVFIVLILCIGLPWVQRGWERGSQDLHEYYHTFLQPFQEGKVFTTYKNQNLAASISRMFTSADDDLGFSYHWITLPEKTVRLFIHIAYIIFSLALFWSWIDRKRNAPDSPGLYQFAMIFAYTHLISGITWSAHLLSFVFMLIPFFLLEIKERSMAFSILYYTVCGWIAFTALAGQDTLGDTLYHYSGGYNLISGLLVFLFFFYLILSHEENRRSQYSDSQTAKGNQSKTRVTSG